VSIEEGLSTRLGFAHVRWTLATMGRVFYIGTLANMFALPLHFWRIFFFGGVRQGFSWFTILSFD